MKKRTYKRMQNRLYREILRRMTAENALETAENALETAKQKAAYYKKRFIEFGKNVDTQDMDKGRYISMLKWELKPEPYGQYACVHKAFIDENGEVLNGLKGSIIRTLVEGIIENDLAQIIVKDEEDPLYPFRTVAAKVYIVPWEQMPHKRTIELKEYVQNVLEDGGL